MEVLRLPEHLETQGVSSVQRERSWSLGCTHKLNEQRIIAPLQRYCQELWIGFFAHAATFSSLPSTSSPLLNFAPALTNATR